MTKTKTASTASAMPALSMPEFKVSSKMQTMVLLDYQVRTNLEITDPNRRPAPGAVFQFTFDPNIKVHDIDKTIKAAFIDTGIIDPKAISAETGQIMLDTGTDIMDFASNTLRRLAQMGGQAGVFLSSDVQKTTKPGADFLIYPSVEVTGINSLFNGSHITRQLLRTSYHAARMQISDQKSTEDTVGFLPHDAQNLEAFSPVRTISTILNAAPPPQPKNTKVLYGDGQNAVEAPAAFAPMRGRKMFGQAPQYIRHDQRSTIDLPLVRAERLMRSRG